MTTLMRPTTPPRTTSAFQSIGGASARSLARLGLIVLIGAVPMQAQAPALTQLLEDAKKAREAAQVVMLATDAGKAYLAAVALERGLAARVQAETKPVKAEKQ